MFDRTVVGKQNWRRRHDLHIDAVTVHFLQADLGIPARRVDVPEKTVTNHDLGFPGLSVLDPRPVRGPVARSQIGPCAREKMIMNIDDWHLYCLPGWMAPQ